MLCQLHWNEKSLPQWKYASISSARIFEVIAMIGTRVFTERIKIVAEMPSHFGIMMSMKIKSNRSGSAFTLLLASSPSCYMWK